MITEKILRSTPALVKAFTGLPAGEFWKLIEGLEAGFPEYERERHERERPDRQRGGRYRDSCVKCRARAPLGRFYTTLGISPRKESVSSIESD